jgi:hypothetical protein
MMVVRNVLIKNHFKAIRAFFKFSLAILWKNNKNAVGAFLSR